MLEHAGILRGSEGDFAAPLGNARRGGETGRECVRLGGLAAGVGGRGMNDFRSLTVKFEFGAAKLTDALPFFS
jgi:hypothetical protein